MGQVLVAHYRPGSHSFTPRDQRLDLIIDLPERQRRQCSCLKKHGFTSLKECSEARRRSLRFSYAQGAN